MTEFDPSSHPHRRCKSIRYIWKRYVLTRELGIEIMIYHRSVNPLTKEYILVSPHRNKRPWLGQVEPSQTTNLCQYDETCYLCPGNTRGLEQKNPHYNHTYTFENDFAAILSAPAPDTPAPLHPLMTVEPVRGACDVLVFHPRHDLSMARLDLTSIEKIIDEWIRIYLKRGTETGIKYVQIFEVNSVFSNLFHLYS